MPYRVGFTIRTVSTELSCDIQAGYESRTWRLDWEYIGGRLEIGSDGGRWFYHRPGGGPRVGIVLFPDKGSDDSEDFGENDVLVELNGVPDRFPEKIECGEYRYGDGLLRRTNEKLEWKMWYPCA